MEFETRINERGLHELVRINKESEYDFRQIFLSEADKETILPVLQEAVTSAGGHWQLDIEGILTVNVPKGRELDIDDLLEELNRSKET